MTDEVLFDSRTNFWFESRFSKSIPTDDAIFVIDKQNTHFGLLKRILAYLISERKPRPEPEITTKMLPRHLKSKQ